MFDHLGKGLELRSGGEPFRERTKEVPTDKKGDGSSHNCRGGSDYPSKIVPGALEECKEGNPEDMNR